MKRKILKQTVAATVLTSSMLTFTPVTYGNTTSIQQSIDSVKMEMKKATQYYVEPALNGEIKPSSSLYPVLNRVKKNVQQVRNDILSSNLSDKKKSAKLKELDVLYEEKITKGLIPYIDAYNYAMRYLEPLLIEIKDAEEKNDFAAVEKAYHKLSVQLKSRTSILYRFTGKAPRDLLLERYKLRADEERNKLMVPVTIFMKMEEAEKLFNEGKKAEAKAVIEGISSLIEEQSREPATSFTNELLKQVEVVQLAIDSKLVITIPEPPVIVPPGEGNTSPAESPAERTLRLAKANAVVELENYEKQVDFSEVDWTNVLLLKESGKNFIKKSTSTTAVEQALLAAKVAIEQVKTKAAAKLALSTVIITAEQLLANHVEGTNVGQVAAADRTALAQAITDAKAIYTDAGNKTQADLEDASTTLAGASTIFEAQVVKAGDATALNTVITTAEQLLVNHAEGTNVGQAAVADRTALAQAITDAKAIYADATNKTQADLDDASTTLAGASTTFEAQVVKSGDATALNTVITTAEQLLVNHAEGTNVGQAAVADRTALAQAITDAKAIYADATNKTQADLDNASTTLTTASTIFEAQVVKAGDATTLNEAITTAEQLLVNHIEGTNVGQATAANRTALAQAITDAKAIYTDAGNKTQADLDDASTILAGASTIFEAQVVKAGDSTALNTVITTAEQLLVNHEEGTNVGQAAVADRTALAQAITDAKAIYADATNKTQADLDDASTTLTTASTIFEAQIVKSGDATALAAAITGATALYTNAVEGTEVNQYTVGSKTTLQTAINVAQLVLADAANKTIHQLADAQAVLNQAVADFGNSKVMALTGLNNIILTGTANDSSNTVVLGTGEALVLSSNDEAGAIATITESPIGTIKVTGVAAGAPIIITVQVKKDGQVIKTGSFTVSVLDESVLSKSLTSFDFSTVNATQAKLVSKPVTTGDFTGNRKDFTIVIGADRIPVYVSWPLSTDFPKGASMGGVVESHIQQYYVDKGGADALMNRPLAAFGFDDTFQISAFQSGSASSFTLEGANWSYFFEQSTAQGTDTDTSKNRTFTISDGTNTAIINLTSNLSTIDALISQINNGLTNANVKILAEKVGTSQFKLSLTSIGGELIIGGINKADFF